MTLALGLLLAAGVLLCASPWLWPAGAATRDGAASRRGVFADALSNAGFAHLPPGRLLVITVAASVLAAGLGLALTGLPAVAVVAGIAGACAPVGWLRSRARRMRRARRALWPDVCDLLVASIRAGQALPDAVAALAVSAPVALRPAFVAFAADMAASGHFDASAARLKASLADPVGDRIIETLRMARQVGGTELTSVLRALSASVRAEAALRAEVEARQSWIRGAAVLGVVAPWVILVLLAMRPEGARAYTSGEGVAVVLIGAAVSVVAFRLMLQVGRLPEPKRSFG